MKCAEIVKISKNNVSRSTEFNKDVLLKDKIIEATKFFPEDTLFSWRVLAIAENNLCLCKECQKCHGDVKREFCSNECRKKYHNSPEYKKSYTNNLRKKWTEEKNKDLQEGYDYIICQICNCKLQDLGSHLKIHSLSSEDYRKQFNVIYLKCQKLIDGVSGEKNPGYQHKGKLSKWSKNFKYGYDEKAHQEFNENQRERMLLPENREKSIFCREHYSSDEEYLFHQSKNLDFFQDKYGDEDGKKRHQEKTEKWLTSFKKTNFSKISQELFNSISKCYDMKNVYYATLERKEMESYINKEYHLRLSSGRYVLPDFIDIGTGKIIEFDGTYWHGEIGRGNKEREEVRESSIKQDGYSIFHVSEKDYLLDKQKVISDCLSFLSDSSTTSYEKSFSIDSIF